jgi:hypothetical protein
MQLDGDPYGAPVVVSSTRVPDLNIRQSYVCENKDYIVYMVIKVPTSCPSGISTPLPSCSVRFRLSAVV